MLKSHKNQKLIKAKNDELNTMSSNLDKEISRISEKSTQLLSDTQESKSIADSVSGQLNQVDNNVKCMPGPALGVRADDLNREMAKNDTTSRSLKNLKSITKF